jgi:hypothetical protein
VVVTNSQSVAPIASELGTPREIFHSMSHNIVNAIVTVAVILFIAFPANIFNQTFSDNYDEIMLMMANERRRLRRLIGRRDPPEPNDGLPPGDAEATHLVETPGRSSRPWFIATLLVGAVLGGLLNPKFGVNAKSIDGFVATIGAFAFGAFLSWLIAKNFRRWHRYPTNTYLKALPFGLGVGALCVIVSRVSHFQPGYLYGIVVSFAFVGSLKDRHSAHLITISTLTTLSVALLAWFAWIPVNHLALESGSNFLVVILDDILGSIFVGGLVGTVVGLLPLDGLPGGHLNKWRRSVWAAVFFLAVFLLIEVELRPASGPSHPGGAPIVTAVVLFVLFGGLSFGMRRYFANRTARKGGSSAAVQVGSDGPSTA